jgi:hypothetical protein
MILIEMQASDHTLGMTVAGWARARTTKISVQIKPVGTEVRKNGTVAKQRGELFQ